MKKIKGKRLTLKEKKLLKKLGSNPDDFLRRSRAADNITFIHRGTGAELPIRI